MGYMLDDRDDRPKEKFRLRPGHAFFLIDLIVLAALFVLGGKLYMDYRGTGVVAEQHQERAAGLVEGAALIAEADSVVEATEQRLQTALADSARGLEELKALRVELDRRVDETARLGQGIYRLSDVVLDMRQNAEAAVAQANRDRLNVEQREVEVDSLRTNEQNSYQELIRTQQQHVDALTGLRGAEEREIFDPKGRFPSKTGVAVRRDVGDKVDLTNLLLEHVLWKVGATDVGLSLGFGLGDEESSSNKEVGVLLTRSLIHRRLGLDFGAGFSQLTRSGGSERNDAYASAGLRVSPFYQERLHLGLGARASSDEVVPFLGFSIGRR